MTTFTPKNPADSATNLPPNLDMFMDVPVVVTVQLGSCQLSMREVLQLNPGSIVQLDKLADAPVEVLLNDKLVARGEVVVLENKFGIKITEMVGSSG
ncbi:MAG TPA: flagellar motor switch protein FliN [Verrucomicrobiae bacterium]